MLICLAIFNCRIVRNTTRYLFQRAPRQRSPSKTSATRNPAIGSSAGPSASSRAFYVSQTSRNTFYTTSANTSKAASATSKAGPDIASTFSAYSTHTRATGSPITAKAAEWSHSRMDNSFKCSYCSVEPVWQFANATSAC